MKGNGSAAIRKINYALNNFYLSPAQCFSAITFNCVGIQPV